MPSLFYLSDLDNSNKVYFDVDPDPIPNSKISRRVNIFSLFPTKSGSNYISGELKVTDLGASKYGSAIEMYLPYISDNNLDAILNKYANPSGENINLVKFYHPVEDKRYTCIFDSNGISFKRLLGVGNIWYTVDINLIIIDSEDLSVVPDEKIKISNLDTTQNYLILKLAAGQSIVLTKLTPAGNEQLQIAVQDATGAQKGVVQYGISGSTACEGNDSRLSDARDPVFSELLQTAMPTPASGKCKLWVDTDDGNRIYLVINSPSQGVKAVELFA